MEIRETGDIYISGTTDSTHINFVDDGDASFSITGTAKVGNTLSITEDTPDPDGTGTFSYSWQSSSNNTNWDIVGTGRNYQITAADEDKILWVPICTKDLTGIAISFNKWRKTRYPEYKMRVVSKK